MNDSYLQYIPPPAPVFSDFHSQVEKIVGLSPNGVDPMIRFIWGMDVIEYWGEEKVYRYPDINEPAKYVGLPFFVMEGWQSPDVYDRDEWALNADILGDFPERGVWDFISVLRTDDYQPLPLGSRALQMAKESRYWRSKGNRRAVEDLIKRRQHIRTLRDQRFQAKKQEILDEMVRQFNYAEQNIKNAGFSFSKEKGGFKRTGGGLLIPDYGSNSN